MTRAAEAHPYDPSLRREHWRRLLSESPLPPSTLAEGWFYYSGDINESQQESNDECDGQSSRIHDYDTASILLDHVARQCGVASSDREADSNADESFRLWGKAERKTRRSPKFEELSIGDIRHWVARSMFSVPSFDVLPEDSADRADAEAMAREFEAKAIASGSGPLRPVSLPFSV